MSPQPSNEQFSSLPVRRDTAAGALWVCAQAAGDARTVEEIAVESGLAFRFQSDDVVSLGCLHAYPWRQVFWSAAARLGYRADIVTTEANWDSADYASEQIATWDFVQRGLQRRRPTLLWGIHAPEFGVAVGQQEGAYQVTGILDGVAPATTDLHTVGIGAVPLIFALQLESASKVRPSAESVLTSLLGALREPMPTLTGMKTGLGAFHQLSRAMASGRIDPAGFAYAVGRFNESLEAFSLWADGHLRADGEFGSFMPEFRRAGRILNEIVRRHPFPLPAHFMLTTDGQQQSAALVEELELAMEQGSSQLADALARRKRTQAQKFPIRSISQTNLDVLFPCVRELPVELTAEAEICRQKLAPRVGRTFWGKLMFQGTSDQAPPVAQILYAPLEDALYPVEAEGHFWFVYCPWVASPWRGRGIGPRLLAAVRSDAENHAIDGLVTVVTGTPGFLYVDDLKGLGFVLADRGEDRQLLWLPLTENARMPKFSPLATAETDQVRIRQAYNCPLLLRSRQELLHAAATKEQKVNLAEASRTEPAGAWIHGRPVRHGLVVLDQALALLDNH